MIARFLWDACAFYEECARRHGDPFSIPTPFGLLILSGKPEGARQIFTAPPDTFQVFARSSVEPFFGPSSILLANGERHRRNRKLLAPSFHGNRVRTYAAAMARLTAGFADKLQPGTAFVAQQAMHEVSLEIILHAFFDARGETRARIRAALLDVQAAVNPALVFVPALRRRFGGLGPWSKFQRAVAALDELLYAAIAERRRAGEGDDIQSLLIACRYEDGSGLSDEEVRDETLSLIGAGHETLAAAMAWGLFWAHHTPAVLEALHSELDSLGADPDPLAMAELPYLDAFCCETLRLSPVLPEVTRLLAKPFEFLGHRLLPGMAVGALGSLVHVDEAVYPEPRAFRPERFLERKYSPFEFIPFGGGNRRCLGAAFAMLEMKLVLGTLLSRHVLRLRGGGPVRPRRHSLPFGPASAVVLEHVSRRRSVPLRAA